MRVFVDSNIIIDHLTKREPFDRDAYDLFSRIAKETDLIGYTSVKSLSDIHYLMKRSLHSSLSALKLITKLTSLLLVLDNTDIDLLKAFSSEVTDFEDALIAESAVRNKLDFIVTRNVRDFERSHIKAITPRQCLDMLDMPPLEAK